MRRFAIVLFILLLVGLGWVWQEELFLSGSSIETAFNALTSVLDEVPASCQINEPELPADVCTIKIGIINTFSKDGEACFAGGQEHSRGYELALEEINESRGPNDCYVDLVPIGDGGDNSQAGEAVVTLASLNDKDPAQDVRLIIGAYSSGATLVAAENAERWNIPLIVPSASSALVTELGYEWVFRINADSDAYVSSAVDYILSLNNRPTIAVIYENTVFGESAAVAVTALAEEKGISIIAYESFQQKLKVGDRESRLRATMGRLKANKLAQPDFVYLISNDIDDAITLLKISRSNLTPQLFIANAGAFISPNFLEKVGTEAENVIVTAQWSEDIKEWQSANGLNANDFVVRFGEKYKNEEGDSEKPSMRSVQTYTSLFLAVEVIERSKGEGEICAGTDISTQQMRLCIQSQLEQIELENTLFGPINFDANGQNNHPALLVRIIGSKGNYRFETVYPAELIQQNVMDE